ncbi:MAG TPA: hypothetical protein DD641_07770, partial [Deltaproteobacteria bacterium]|nr:hypothetical protein [Deltaproteobacteria bacterium]
MKSSKCKVQSLPLQILSRGSNLKKTNNLFFILLLFFSLFTFHFSLLTSSSLARDIASQRECAVCHIEWLEELRRKDVTPLVEIPQTPVMIRGRQGVVSTERMCFTCHDGYVNDSRFAFDSEKHRHPVYVKPSDKIKIPATREGKQVFPLNLKGEIYCGTCHSAHGRSWDDMGDKTKTLFLREPTENSAICLACHIDRAMGPKEGMHPFFKTGKIAKLPTEELEELGARIGTTKEGAGVICQSCHRIKGAPEKKLLIIKNDNSELCGLCHADRYTHTREEAAQRSTHPVNILSDKIDISKKAVELGSKTGTNGKIICQTCHRPHYAEKGGKILVRKASSDSGFCKICHEDKKTVEITKHNIAVMSPENKNAKDIPARESGPCGACHFAHSGKGPKLWARETKEGNDPFERLCLSCHSKGSVAEKKTILSGPYSHPVGVNIKKLGASTDLPLFDENGLLTGKKDEGNVLCNTCHNVHQWDPLDPNRASRKDEEGDGSTSFLRKPVQVFSDLCLECHKDKIKVRETKHDMAVMSKDLKDIRGENVLKGAGVCGGCHVPHNGKGPKMWAQEIKFGRSPIEGMCLSCHNEDGIAQKKPVGKNSHPIGEDVKKLGVALNTKLPLFTAEGMRTGKGNEGLVTCFTCHDPHQWNPQDLADKGGPGIEGDGKTSFLRARNEDSNLCGECHADRYTRTREEAIKKGTHPVNITSQKVDIQGKVAEIGGMLGKDGAIICQSCHAVHNAVSKRLLVKANTDNASFCKICHEDKKTVEITKHNIAVMFPDDKNAKGIPAKESGPCGSCHFAHGGKGPKLWAREMKEGNDPFERLCLSCHSKGSVAEKKSILSGPYSHPVGVNIKKLGASTDLPLFDENGLLTGKKDDGNVLCNTC